MFLETYFSFIDINTKANISASWNIFVIYNTLCGCVKHRFYSLKKNGKLFTFLCLVTKKLNWKHRVFCAATYYINSQYVKLHERPLSRLELSLNNTTINLSSVVFRQLYKRNKDKCINCYIRANIKKTDIPLVFEYWWKCVFMLYW